MAKYRLTADTGEVYEIEGPDDATEEELIAQVSQVAAQPKAQPKGRGAPLTPAENAAYAKKIGATFTPEQFMEPMTFMERMGKRFVAPIESFAKVAGQATGGQPPPDWTDYLKGTLGFLNFPLAPLGAAVEQAGVGAGISEPYAELLGDVGEAVTGGGMTAAAAYGKLPAGLDVVARLTGSLPGSLKAAGNAKDFIKQAGGDVRGEAATGAKAAEELVQQAVARAQSEAVRAAQGAPAVSTADDFMRMLEGARAPVADVGPQVREVIDTAGPFDRIKVATPEELIQRLVSENPAIPPVEELGQAVRGVQLDPTAMARTSSLLEQAQQTVVPNPGNITAGAAMETAQGQVPRTVQGAEKFRTTQQSIERVTGNQQALLAERAAEAEKLMDLARAQQTAREMQAVERMTDLVAPVPQVGPPVGPVGAGTAAQRAVSGKRGSESVRDVERFILTGKTEYLKKAAKAADKTPDAVGANVLVADVPDLIKQGGGKEVGRVSAFLRSAFFESTRDLASRGGVPGKVLAKEMLNAVDLGEREAGAAVTMAQKILSGLTKGELDSVVDVLDTGAMAVSKRAMDAASQIRTLLDEVAMRAETAQLTIRNANGETVPWAPRGNYFPHFSTVDVDAIIGGSKKMSVAVKELAEAEGVDLARARDMLDGMIQNAQQRFGNLERQRIENYKSWDRDPVRALTKYFDGSYKRLAMAEQFGADYKRADTLAEAVGQVADDKTAKFAQEWVNRITGRAAKEMTYGAKVLETLGAPIRHLEAATKLGQAVISNISQPVLALISSDAKAFGKAVGDMVVNNAASKEFAGMTGAALDSTMAQIYQELAGGTLGQKVLRYSGFSAVERFNRILASNVGKNYAEGTFNKLMYSLNTDGARADFLKRELERLNIDPAAAIGRGSLSQDDLYQAGQRFVRRTQFKTSSEDLPHFATSEAGKFIYQFKSFGLKSAQYIKDEIIKEAAKGNYRPLTRALIAMPLTGEIINDVQAFINGKERTRNPIARLADDIAAVGGISLAYSFYKSIEFGPSAIAGTVFGPAVGDALKTTANVGSLLTRGNAEPLAKQAVQAIPTFGPMIANRVWPSREQQRLQKENR